MYNSRFIDQVIAFLNSVVWELLKQRYTQYVKRLDESRTAMIRARKWDSVSYIQGKIDGVDELIKITEHLGKELSDSQLAVDAALGIIKNNPE